VLYNTYGQLVDVGGGRYLHLSIDLGAVPNEPVFAVEDGIVLAAVMSPDPGEQRNCLIVSRGDDLEHGIQYTHLATSEVRLGQEVRRDQLLGTVVEWEASCGFDHLDLKLVENVEQNPAVPSRWNAAFAADDGNPLLFLAPLADPVPPAFSPQTLEGGASSVLTFYEDGSGAEVQAGSISGPVDIVARIHDLFPGSGPAYDAIRSACPQPPPQELAPLRIDLRVKGPLPPNAPDDAASGSVGEAREYLNIIDFSQDIQSPSATQIYLDKSKGSYVEHDLYFVLTHGMTSSLGAWSPEANGLYSVEVTATDASGNVGTQTLQVTVDLD